MRRKRIMRWLAALAALAVALVLAMPWLRDFGLLHLRHNMLTGLELTCKVYANDHHGAMPPDLRAVFPQYIDSSSYLAYTTNEVEYFPGAIDHSNPATVLMREKYADARGRRWVGHVDGSVELEKPPHP